jgi:hypothetical protein
MIHGTRRVRFHPRLITSTSRPLIDAEQWALEDFEFHARTCRKCDPEDVHLHYGTAFCKAGQNLVHVLFGYFKSAGGKIYSNTTKGETVIVEIPVRFYYGVRTLRSNKGMLAQQRPPARPFNLVRHCIARWGGSARGWEYTCTEQYRLRSL